MEAKKRMQKFFSSIFLPYFLSLQKALIRRAKQRLAHNSLRSHARAKH